jgi:putative aminopeptidase FrvX
MNIDMEYVKKFLVEIMDITSCGGCTDTAIARLKEELDSFGVENRMTNKRALIGTIQGECDDDQREISAHIDTLGAIVKEIKPNGRLKVTNIGGFAWQSVEGENAIIQTSKGKVFTGTMLPEKASIHVFSDEVRESARTEDTMEIRIDEETCTKEETEKLGIRVGDFVNFETRTRITENGYIKSRYLDDKACVAALFGVIKYFKDNNLKPKYTTHFYFSNYEEIGHGISVIPEKVTEFVALDIGTVGKGHTSDEHCVTILAKDSRTPYDFSFREKLVQIAESNEIDYRVDVHYRYGSDASIAALAGFDTNFACIGMGVDATHHYERTHVDGILNNIKLLVHYLY